MFWQILSDDCQKITDLHDVPKNKTDLIAKWHSRLYYLCAIHINWTEVDLVSKILHSEESISVVTHLKDVLVFHLELSDGLSNGSKCRSNFLDRIILPEYKIAQKNVLIARSIKTLRVPDYKQTFEGDVSCQRSSYRLIGKFMNVALK